jgi:hypothetical protein
MILVGTAPRGGEDIMRLDKPTLAGHLADPTLKGYAVLQKIFFAPTSSSQAAGRESIERLAERKENIDPVSRVGRTVRTLLSRREVTASASKSTTPTGPPRCSKWRIELRRTA